MLCLRDYTIFYNQPPFGRDIHSLYDRKSDPDRFTLRNLPAALFDL